MKKLIAGNHKMFTGLNEGLELASELARHSGWEGYAQVVLFPPFTHLNGFYEKLKGTGIGTGAQNCSDMAEGAYTGEVSAGMIKSTGASYVLIGHSERRTLFGEGHELLCRKINQALDAGLHVIYCYGENLQDMESGRRFSRIEEQLQAVFESFSRDELDHLSLAYEPVWAIGTGKTATLEQAGEAHAFSRELFGNKYGSDSARALRILYGGSVKASNARELLSSAEINGVLVGGASLNAAEFLQIIEAAG